MSKCDRLKEFTEGLSNPSDTAKCIATLHARFPNNVYLSENGLVITSDGLTPAQVAILTLELRDLTLY